MDNVTTTQQLFKDYQFPIKQEKNFRNQRDELVDHFVRGINLERASTKYKPITAKMVAIRLNKNPFLAKNDSEVYNLLKECQNRSNYSKFFWVTK